jgi:hypothetical protein
MEEILPHTVLYTVSSCEEVDSITSIQELTAFLKSETESEFVSTVTTEPSNNTQWRPSEKIQIKNKELNQEQKKKLKALIDKYWTCFSLDNEDVGSIADKYGRHDIKLIEKKPIKQRPYQTPYAKERVVNECVEKRLKMNIIEPTQS